MNMSDYKLLTGILSIIAVSILALSAQEAEDEDEIFELSPFTIDEQENQGYQAASTLAGSRLRTPLRDVGSAVQVLTKELFDDTGATDANTVLSYSLNVEVGGTQGNFANPGVDQSRVDENANRINPQGNQRIRGLDSATLTRNFFLTEVPLDSYNSSRVTINRGPNSILFGVGSPGGIINNNLNNATLGASFGEVLVRFGGNNSHRESFDYNSVLVEDRVAIRVAGLNESQKFKQKPAFEDDRRIFFATEIVLLENEDSDFFGEMILRANIENGEINSNPPKSTPPLNDFAFWWDPPSINYQQYSGASPDPEHVPPVYESQHTYDPLAVTPLIDANTVSQSLFHLNGVIVYPDASGNSPPNAESSMFPGAHGFQSRLHFAKGVILYDTRGTQHASRRPYAAGFSVPSIQDRKIFDYHNLLFSGNNSRVEQDFDTFNVALEQTFFEDDRAGIEVVFDKQNYERWSRLQFADGGNAFSPSSVSIDISEVRGTGEPNPNVGRPMVAQIGSGFSIRNSEREAARVTAFYDLDFEDMFEDGWGRWLGRHTLTGFAASQEFTETNRSFANSWFSDEIDVASDGFGGPVGRYERNPIQYVYVGPSLLNASGPGDVRLEQINIPIPQDGDVYRIWYKGNPDLRDDFGPLRVNNFRVGTHLSGGNINKREIDSEALVIQNRFLNGHVVGLFGWRTDESTDFEQITEDELEALTGDGSRVTPEGFYREDNFMLRDTPTANASGDTFSQSVVVHVPDNWTSFLPGNVRLSGHYGESENFSPSGVRRTVYGGVLGPPSGVTEERGFTIEVNDRFFARFNWFTTSSEKKDTTPIGLSSADVRQTIERIPFYINRAVVLPQNNGFSWEDTKAFMLLGEAGNPDAPAPGTDPIPNINSFDDMFQALLNIFPPEVQAIHDFRVVEREGVLVIDRNSVPGTIATSDVLTEGFEVDLVANPTDNWRIMLNVGNQEAASSNGAPEQKRLVDYMNAQWAQSGLFGLRDSVTFGARAGFQRRWANRVIAPLNSFLAKEGTSVPELRKWRANLITTYDFSGDTALKGWSVGGAVRWQDEITIGFDQFVSPEAGIQPDLDNPIIAPDQLNGDIWISHVRKLTERIDWKIQLNMRNAFGDNDDIPVKADPNGDIAIIRIPNEQLWFVTNTFSF